MIRRAKWTDLAPIRRMAESLAYLDIERLYTQGTQGVKQIIAGAVGLLDLTTTIVWHREGEPPTAFAQLAKDSSGNNASVSCLGPNQAYLWPDAATSLLEGLVVEAGLCGSRNVTADVNEGKAAFTSLRKAGFVVYARQLVYGELDSSIKNRSKHNSKVSVTKCIPQDRAEIYKLYNNIVPALVKQVEGVPVDIGSGFVIRRDGTLAGIIGVNEGPKGIWVKPYLYPEVGIEIGYALADFVLFDVSRAEKPAYISSRSYQPWLRGILEDTGFALLSKQAVMVKRTAVRIDMPIFKSTPGLVASDSDTSIPVSETKTQDVFVGKIR